MSTKQAMTDDNIVTSVFARYEADAWPYRWAVELYVDCLVGGTPASPVKAEHWIRGHIDSSDNTIRQMVAETMAELGVSAEDAATEVVKHSILVGFKQDDRGLYYEGRCAKAMLKEAGNVAWDGRKWGAAKRKGTLNYLAEHMFVVEDRIHLGVTEPTGAMENFVHVYRGNGIKHEEYVSPAILNFTVITDINLSGAEWAHLWLKGEQIGCGASRSQSYGKFKVTTWERLA